MEKGKCKICRRAGVKLFLKGEKCFSTKCPMIKRPYPPGPPGKRRKGPPSEYAKQLRQKQKLKAIYNLGERQFKKYVKEVLEKRGKVADASETLIKILELRLDNVVFRLGFAKSRAQARQLISHGHFLVNGRPVNIPSFRVKKGDVIKLKPQKTKKVIFEQLKILLKNQKTPSWLKLDPEKLEGEVIGEPTLKEVAPPVEISTIFEYYSK
jgi:small subunit ribosomal protein S4